MKKMILAAATAATLAAAAVCRTPPLRRRATVPLRPVFLVVSPPVQLSAVPLPAPPPAYYGPGPAYVAGPPCYWQRQRFWDGYGWRIRNVQVCQ